MTGTDAATGSSADASSCESDRRVAPGANGDWFLVKCGRRRALVHGDLLAEEEESLGVKCDNLVQHSERSAYYHHQVRIYPESRMHSIASKMCGFH